MPLSPSIRADVAQLLLKRALAPIQSLIVALRMHDSDRATAARSSFFNPHRAHHNHRTDGGMSSPGLTVPSSGGSYFPGAPAPPSPSILNGGAPNASGATPGHISPLAKVYLSDVLDHIDAVLSSLELFSGLAQNLVDFRLGSDCGRQSHADACIASIRSPTT